MKLRLFLLTGFLALTGAICFAQTAPKQTREEYISRYKDLAIKQMKASGIPASIILAQGCFESSNGNSRLCVEANNHFGIKCHTTWDGERIYHDDDEAQECFRKYSDPEGSFSDHSDFLRYRDRYKFLFDLPSTDYKSWAYGLKKAGYATNPEYAERLIKIIDEYQLYNYDTGVVVEVPTPTEIEAPKIAEASKRIGTATGKRATIIINREVYEHNGVQYVLTRTNDTYELIANEYGIKPKRILSYNDVKSDVTLEKGQRVYLQSKKNKAEKLQPVHIAEDGESLWQISQRYAVELTSLQKYNLMQPGENPVEGQEVFLRNKRER